MYVSGGKKGFSENLAFTYQGVGKVFLKILRVRIRVSERFF